jgi:DNA-binding NtrC family response regulator
MAVILIVEDDEQVRVLAQSVLQEAGHTVIAATGADSATALLETEQHVDVLFVDLSLGSDLEAGLKVAQVAKSKRSHLSVLYTTGSAVNAGMKAMFVEPFLFLPKPYTFEQLTKSVAFLLLKANPSPIRELRLGDGGSEQTR